MSRRGCSARSIAASLALLLATGAGPGRPDLPVASFEGDDYGGWTVEGTAFGTAPARGALPGQMAVEGFHGRGLVSSFVGGDDATGTLTSPPFRVDRHYLNFLIGGGKYPGETCLELLVDAAVVRAATGPNDRPGGAERLEPASWDVAEFAGKEAVLRVVDRRKGGWGHINVDQIVQGDRRSGIVPAALELAATKRYLHLPVKADAPTRRVRVEVDGRVAREFDVKLADGPADFLAFLDLAPFLGRTIRLAADLPADPGALARIAQADEVPDAAHLYREPGRPQFHFTSRRGWLNDPNGLVRHEGQYHLFYQHNPYGWDWGNMHWGHAVSPDLIHWRELPIALYPRQYGDWCFSGSAVVDRANTSGFGSGQAPALVVAFTSTGRGECIASSLDGGRTWSEFAGNPVVRHAGRDPRLFRHEPTGRWIMAVYDEEGGRRAIAFHSSPDLKAWTFESQIDGFFECPDLFELPVEGEPGRKLWVLSGADGGYLLGQFDGHRFTPDSPTKQQTWHGDFYAAQTFTDAPDGRRIQVGWARGTTFPGMPFNQQMNIPCDLTLRPTADGVRQFARPVAELATLRVKSQSYPNEGHQDPLREVEGDLFEVHVEVTVGPTGGFTLEGHGTPVTYDAERRTLTVAGVSAPMAPEDGVIKLQVLVDRGSVEVFGNDGRVAIARPAPRRVGARPLGLTAVGPGTRIASLVVHDLKSAWTPSR